MTTGSRKRVSDQSMSAIREALAQIGARPDTPRTKREVERLTGLSHDLVARAFRQDHEDPGSWQLNELFAALGDGPARRRTAEEQEQHDLTRKLKERNHELADARRLVNAAASTILALEVELGRIRTDPTVVPFPGRRARD